AAPQTVPSFTSFSSRMKGKLSHQRIYQTSFLALMLLSLAIYLGTRAGAGTFQPEPASDLSSPNASAISSLKHTPGSPVAAPSVELFKAEGRQALKIRI